MVENIPKPLRMFGPIKAAWFLTSDQNAFFSNPYKLEKMHFASTTSTNVAMLAARNVSSHAKSAPRFLSKNLFNLFN